jgi:ABC-type branched-subunit amino acid transport system permease subunit
MPAAGHRVRPDPRRSASPRSTLRVRRARRVGLPVYRTSTNRAELYYWTALVLLLFTVFCSVRLRDSRLGRAWIAIREDEIAAAAMGVPLMRTKTWAYAAGAFLVAWRGVLRHLRERSR